MVGWCLWGALGAVHTPLFPAYSYWGASPSQVGFFNPKSPADYGHYIDARYRSALTSLPVMAQTGWSPVNVPAQPTFLRDQASAPTARGQTFTSPGSDAGNHWIAAYYLPLDLFVIDGFIHHPDQPFSP